MILVNKFFFKHNPLLEGSAVLIPHKERFIFNISVGGGKNPAFKILIKSRNSHYMAPSQSVLDYYF